MHFLLIILHEHCTILNEYCTVFPYYKGNDVYCIVIHSINGFEEIKSDPSSDTIYNKKALVFSLFTYCIHSIIELAPEDVNLSLLNGSIILKINVTIFLWIGIVTNELMDNPLTRNNFLSVIHSLSEVSTLSFLLVDTKIFEVLSSYLQNSLSTKVSVKSQEFCSTFLRNISLHQFVMQKFGSLFRFTTNNTCN